MKKKSTDAKRFDGLRKKAEKTLAHEEEGTQAAHNEVQRTIHDLRVHQVELEMQNDELRKAQEDLGLLKEKYAELYDFAPVGYFTLDRFGKILDLNMTGYRLFKGEDVFKNLFKDFFKGKDMVKGKDFLKGKPFSRFIYAADREIFAGHLRDVIEKKTLQRCELRLRDPGRHFFHAQLHSIAFGEGQEDMNCRTVVNDISELHRLRSEREAYIKDLESFGTAASHELRGPLISISRFSEVLAEDFGKCLGEDGVKVTGIISEKARQMDKLLSSLLEFSKISTTQIRKRKIRMNDLIDKVCHSLIGSERFKVKFEIHPVPHATGDPLLIERAVTNLVANALKYTAQTQKTVIEIGGYVKEDEAVYFVKDNGVGFDPRYSFKLFDLFQRLHSSKDFPGTGTGLYIVRRIAEKHGGRVWAESKPGEGATFYFALPVE